MVTGHRTPPSPPHDHLKGVHEDDEDPVVIVTRFPDRTAPGLSEAMPIIGPVDKIAAVAVVYGLGTATFYATYLVCGKRVLEEVPAITATLVILTTAAIAYMVAAFVTGVQLPNQAIGWVGVG